MQSAGRAQDFAEKWPYINYMLQAAGTNFVSMGIETGTTGRVVYQGNGVWGIYFPVAGIVTNEIHYTYTNDYLNVLGGFLGLNGSPTGTTRYITLYETNLTSRGFLKTDYFPAESWPWAPGLGFDVRIKGYSTGLKIRNYADDDWRDLQCRNLFVWGTQTIANVTTLDVATNKITLNSGWSGPPLLDSWLAINRGSEAEARIKWNEATDRWEFGTTNAMRDLEQIYLDTTSWTNWLGTNTLPAQIAALEGGAQTWNQAATDGADWTNWWATYGSAWAALTNDQVFYNSWTGSWSWVVTDWSNSVARSIQAADTQRWDQAATDGADWTNWWEGNADAWATLTNETLTNVVYSLGDADYAGITGRTLYVTFNTNQAASSGGLTNIASTAGGTSLVYSVTSDTGTLKGLKSGSNVTLTDDGTNVTIAAAGGSSGGSGSNKDYFYMDMAGTNQTGLTASAYTGLIFNRAVQDSGPICSPTNGSVTITTTGRYVFSAKLSGIAAGGSINVCLYTNGVQAVRSQGGQSFYDVGNTAVYMAFLPSYMMNCVSGDVIKIYAYPTYATATVYGNTTNGTYFTGFRLSE